MDTGALAAPRPKVVPMQTISSELKSLRGAAGRAALAVLAFAALTLLPLANSAASHYGPHEQVDQAAAPSDSSRAEDAPCG